MKLIIRLQIVAGKWAIHIDNNPDPSHYVEDSELQALLKEARYGHWSVNPEAGQELGRRLFTLLNRNNGQLQDALDECAQSDSELFLYVSLPMEFTEIPFELLYYNGFIALKPKVHIVRPVSEKTASIQKEDRPLKILFVAASPLDLEHATLQFEKEEDLIFKVTENYPLDFQVEDTGSLDGIEQMLYEIEGTDILYISGHAGQDSELGPVFYMEDEIGKMDKVTPERLYNAIKDSCPKVLFLSGCSTGKSDKNIGFESFAYQMVEMGVPFVLSWGLPVSDRGATSFAGVLYEKLAKGTPLLYALHESLLSLKDDYHPWPLMRLFTNCQKCEALVEKGQKNLRKSTRQIIHKNLKDSNVRILDRGFIGRRRELQRSLAVMKNKAPYDDQYGLLIRGPAGVGKSCLAGRIFERQSLYDIIVLRGELDHSIIINKLIKFFDKRGDQQALAVLGADLSYEEKIKELYRTTFKENNLIIYFDDFEDNLRSENNTWYLKPEFINNFRPFLQYIDYAENQSKIAITSRYAFDLQADGANLSKKFLLDIPLMSFKGPDENKKIRELPHIAKSKNIALYKQFGHGNPRLMEWLDTIAADEKKYDLDKLQKELEGQEEEYIRKYLADIIAGAESSDFMQFLHKSSVYRLPVEASAFETFGDKTLLGKGVDITLFEKEAAGQEKLYWVMPVIRRQMWEKLQKKEQKKAHKTALKWYDAYLEDNRSIPFHTEALFHALEINENDSAAKHVVPIGNELNRLLYYREQKGLLEGIISRVKTQIIAQAKKNKKQSISLLLNQYASLLHDLGDAKKAVEYYEQALEIDLAVFGDKHPNVATCYNNLGSAYRALGDDQKAVEYFERALDIDLTVFGDKHQNVAIRYNNLGLAYKTLGDAKKAVEYFERALEIDLTVFGDKHPDVAIDYNNLGLAYQDLGEIKKAVEYFERALEIDLTVFGDKHPKVANRYNNLGATYQELGDAKKAVEYYERALYIDLTVFGDKHPNVATHYNNLGSAYHDLGETKKAVEYYERALDIVTKVYGTEHPYIATTYNNLGSVYQDLGEAKKAVVYYELAVEIVTKVYGQKHPHVSATYNNLGSAYKALGETKKAVEYYELALEIDLAVFGDKHSKILNEYVNLASFFKSENNTALELKYLLKAFELAKSIAGAGHEYTQSLAKRIEELKKS